MRVSWSRLELGWDIFSLVDETESAAGAVHYAFLFMHRLRAVTSCGYFILLEEQIISQNPGLGISSTSA